MIIPRINGDLNVKYRPCTFSEMIGSDNIIKMLVGFILQGKTPHAMLFTGTSGCGKTTAARIMALSLNCFSSNLWNSNGGRIVLADNMAAESIKENGYKEADPCCDCQSCKSIINLNSMSVQELDGARTSDISTIRSTLDDLPSAPMGGERYKILILDEAHNLSGKAEDALLKFLEDTPPHVYIILCTNEYQKLKTVTKNRCKTIQFGRSTDTNIYNLLEQVSQFEGFSYNKEILSYIAQESEGVPRAALSYLQMVASEGSWTKEAASLVINAGIDIDYKEVMDFCRVLIKGNFINSIEFYKKVKNVPPEIMRVSICGFFVGCLKKARSISEANKFSEIIDFMSKPLFNMPKPEHILTNNFFKITQILQRRG